jgi:hypothetical protein
LHCQNPITLINSMAGRSTASIAAWNAPFWHEGAVPV